METIYSPNEENRFERRGLNHQLYLQHVKKLEKLWLPFPEGEFHGPKARQRQNRAKSIRECKEEPS